MNEIQETVELVHRVVGYPLAFIVGPIAIATFAGKRGHRIIGWAYVVLMIFLYVTGTFLTLTRHDWSTWNFARNVVFNFFGFSFVLHGLRAIYLYRDPSPHSVGPWDRRFAVLLAVSVAGLLGVAIFKHTPMRVYTAVGIALVVLERRELREKVLTRATLLLRHLRYILASYFYVLTVVSLVHLRDEIPSRNVRWLWATVLGTIVVVLATDRSRRLGPPGRKLRWAVRTTLVVSILFGAYVTYELIRAGSEA